MSYENASDGSASDTENDVHAAGSELAAACEAAGIKVSFSSINADSVAIWWDQQARLYASAEDFLVGYGISSGGTVELTLNSIGGVIVGDEDNPENATAMPSNNQIVFTGTDGGEYSINAWQEITHYDRTGTGGPFKACVNTCHCEITKDGEMVYQKESLAFDAVIAVMGAVLEYDKCWIDAIDGGYYIIGENGFSSYYFCFPYYYKRHVGYEDPQDDWEDEYSGTVKIGPVYITDPELATIVISYNPAGGGGGGGTQTTLVFTATAGLSGRHCDPMNGDTDANHPIARSEVPAYGSGGYGGHGGGGGAGASTVVIYKFNTGKADSVEQIAIAKRHGYGSGGGAGGRGGDGCILIFW